MDCESHILVVSNANAWLSDIILCAIKIAMLNVSAIHMVGKNKINGNQRNILAVALVIIILKGRRKCCLLFTKNCV